LKVFGKRRVQKSEKALILRFLSWSSFFSAQTEKYFIE